MNRRLTSLAAATTLAVAIGAVGAPAAAATDATVMFVQGIPGKAVELCVNDKELKSNFQYGGKLKKSFGAGTYKIKIRNKAAGVCKGSLITKITTTLASTDSITVVPGKGGSGPKIRVFNNNALFTMASRPAAASAAFIVSNAAKQGALDAYIAEVIALTAPTPTLPNIRQTRQRGIFANEGFFSTWMSKTGSDAPIFGPVNKETALFKVNHYVAVGTKAKNRKLVFFRLPFPITD